MTCNPPTNNVKARDPVGSNKKNMDNKISLKTQIRFSLHSKENKFALLWGEAQLCLPSVCL